MTLPADDFAAIVAEANLAPSVHNTQPTRWRRDAEGRVLVLEDTARRLTVGDPDGRDAAVSHGAAIEGFTMACAARGISVGLEALELPSDAGLRPVARLILNPGGSSPDDLGSFVQVRRTYRGAFAPSWSAGGAGDLGFR